MGRRRTAMDLRNVGLPLARCSQAETKGTDLARYPANDAPYNYYPQCTKQLGGLENRPSYNFLLLPMVDPLFGYAFDRLKNQKVMLVTAFSPEQEHWFDLECTNIHDGKKYRMANSSKERNPSSDVGAFSFELQTPSDRIPRTS